jgi:PhzF family phenazine biosynthesis protein
VVLNANGWNETDMKDVARASGHESAFVMQASNQRHDFRFRFFVPNHEMEMCGHATLGALWLLRHTGRWTSTHAIIETLSGTVEARYDERTGRIDVGQPSGIVEPVSDPAHVAEVLRALDLTPDDLLPLAIVNARTSRTKTLVPLRSAARLHAIVPRLDRIQPVCDALASTGLYPFAVDADAPETFHARQFPRSSGYAEDPATGIAATALLYGAWHQGLLAPGQPGMVVRQGAAMGRPSAISVAFRDAGQIENGCWLSGAVSLMNSDA